MCEGIPSLVSMVTLAVSNKQVFYLMIHLTKIHICLDFRWVSGEENTHLDCMGTLFV